MKILTTAVNNPIFIELQFTLLKKYMPPDVPYEFIVFNDAKNFPDKTNQGNLKTSSYIESICNYLGIKCIRIPNDHHKRRIDPSFRCADSMNFILQYQRNNPPDEYIILDSDMFPIAPINIDEYRKYNCALLLQVRFEQYYFWHGILYFNFNKITNTELMNWNCMPGFDTGGMMIKWLKEQDTNTIYKIKNLPSLEWDKTMIPEFLLQNTTEYNNIRQFIETDPRNSTNGKFFCEIYDNTYLHYRAGSNWKNEGIQFHVNLTNKLRSLLLANV